MPAKGNTSQRGYGAAHQKLRRQIDPVVRAGKAQCWRCGLRIEPGSDWDLGHDDHDRTRYKGPEHVACNRSTSGRKARTRATADKARDW